MFSGCTSLESVDVSEFSPRNAKTINTYYMFNACSSLKEVDLSKWYAQMIKNNATVDMKYMFRNCTSLEKVSFEGYPHTFSYNGAATGIFTNCKSLRELNLYFDRATGKSFDDTQNSVFAGLNELSLITINDKWKKSTKWVPVKTRWTKVALAPTSEIPAANQVPVGTVLENNTLFTDYKSTYAGTWAAESDFGFNSMGGTPDIQFISGVKNSALNYDGSIETPARAGYTFNGWHKDMDVDSPFLSGGTADQWDYYAHWTDNTYKLILNAHGGHIENTSVTRIEYDNVKYSEFKKLDRNAFVKDGGQVLVGWNTRADGTGESFAPDDSVSRLTATDGGEVTLYAMWHTPQAIVSFDAQGGSAVEDKHFDELPEDFGVLSDSQRTDYTFLGWYTQAEGGEQVNEDDPVTDTCTLYAHWQKNPGVTFDAGAGYFDGDDTKKTVSKFYKYNSYIGLTPTPENGSASFLGWYAEGSSTPVDSEFKVTEDTILTARWGYVPSFDTDGGILGSSMPEYEPQLDPNYTITSLPAITKENHTFLGWKHGDDWVWQAGTDFPSGGVSVDLSADNKIKAVWQQKAYCTVTLDPNSGSLAAGEINPIKVYANTPIAALPTPTRSGYDFAGWYLGETKQTVNSTYTEDVTLKANWLLQNRTVTFNAGEGVMDSSTSTNIVKTKTIKVNDGKTIPGIPGANCLDDKGGIVKAFGGWYSEENGQGTRLTENTVIDQTTEGNYYAYWVDNTQNNSTYKYTYYAQWNTKSDSSVSDTGDRLVFHPINSSNLSAGLKVLFQTDGAATPVPVGGVKIKVPKYIFKDWSNKPITTNNAEDVLSNNFSLDKTSDPDYYVYTNIEPLSGSDTVYTLNYTFSPLNVDGGYIDENGYYHGGYVNEDIKVKIEVDMNGDGVPETDYTKKLAAEVHTKVDTSVSKYRSNVSLTWNSDWGTAPADANDYFYVEWKLSSTHQYSNYSQKFYLMWDENTVRDNGTVVYADECIAHGDVAGQWTTLKENGTKIYTVVTKHRRDLARPAGGDQWATVSNEAILNVKWRSGYVEQFRTSATATAYIPPTGGGHYGFSKFVPNMDKNESHYKHGGQELLTNREADSMPKLPYEISYTEGANGDNPTWNPVTGKYTASKRTITLVDGLAGDVVISSNSGNYSTDSWANSTALEDSDYYFDSLTITVTEYDASKLGDEWSNPYEHTILSDYGHTQIWVRRMNSDAFTLHKDIVITSKSDEVALPADTVGYKIVHESEFFATTISVTTNLCLKPTQKLATFASDDVRNKKKTLIKNKATLDVVCGENTRSYSSDSTTWPCTYVLDLSSTQLFARKSCASQSRVTVDGATMSELVPTVISGWNYNNSGNKKRFTGGEFYDLLPKDFSVDKDSVYVKPILENWGEKDYDNKKISANNYDTEVASGTLSKGAYSVSFVNDWEGSGRTMMIVKVSVPDSIVATGAHVYFKMRTMYSSIYINGATQMNMAAFVDKTESIMPPERRVSKLEDNAIDPTYKYCFADIDSDFTAFASATTDLRLPPIHESGIDSTVRAEMTSSKHQTVGLNTDYTYYILYGSGIGSLTEDLVFYNVIEHRLDGLDSEWQGEFKGVDISTIYGIENALDETATCAPVVWYAVSTGENAKLKESFVFDSATEDDDFNLEQNTFWTTTPPENLSEVTAIAVDCRKDTNGNPFTLKPESNIGFNINMHSTKDPDANNIYTYNEAIIRFTMANVHTRVNQHTQTDVLLHFNTPTFEKTAFPSSGSEQEPAVVVKNSVLEYTLKITNPDTEVPMNDIVVTDTLDASLVKVNEGNIRVKLGDSEETNIGKSVHISSYSLVLEDGYYKFRAVVPALEMGETISIILPVTVAGEKNQKIDNTAKITSVNGAEFEVSSNTDYHIIDDPQVKILKVNSKDEPLSNAKLVILNNDAGRTPADIRDSSGALVGEFYSGSDVVSYSIQPGRYILHEVATPNDEIYKYAQDISFRIDSDGFAHVNNQKTDVIKMVDVPAYKVVFHENRPGHDDEIFRVYEPGDLEGESKKISHFYDIPSFAGDEYVFAGWYYDNDAYFAENASAADTPLNFETQTYPKTDESDPQDYHIYAKWIEVGTVSRASGDTNIIDGNYRGFGLAGVQIRGTRMFDSNYNTDIDADEDRTPGGMRFVTSLSESLLSSIDALSAKTVSTPEGNVNVEYGYVVGTSENINTFATHYGVKDSPDYKLQYKGENVNGEDTTGKTRTAKNDYRYITNVNCTRGTANTAGTIKDDHRNFAEYRLYTLVVTYEGDSASKKGEKVNARSYIRYYDSNGKLRVFYNDYKKNMYCGGCMCSFNQVAGMAIPTKEE